MGFGAYHRVLRLPGVATLLLVGFLARIPITAMSIALTLHVVEDQHRGYAAAGLVGAAMTVGNAIGSPLLGRWVDRVGMRPVITVTGLASAAFWVLSPVLPFPWLLVTALLAGVLTMPAFSIVRQALTALVPEAQRRQAFSIDAMTVEMSYMLGPAGAVLIAAGSPTAAMMVIGGGLTAAAILLLVVNPPTRAAHEEKAGLSPRIPRRRWLRSHMIAALAVAAATTLILGGTDVAVVAALRDAGELSFTGLALAAWGLSSLVGGFIYGGLPRPFGAIPLLIALGLLTIPVGLGSGSWWLLALILVPAGLVCAPTLTATTEQVSRLAPASVRGEALGLHGSALTIGMALGAPLAGAVIDRFGAGWGFAAVGAAGLVVAVPALVLSGFGRRRAAVLIPEDDGPAAVKAAAGAAR